ncbi:MAG: nitronate monooxygenase [Gaiellales bacterium]|nr:nitronate monooxygenase [Gaiellales bacterium]
MRRQLADLLGIRHPILLAAMAGGPSTPELAAEVSRAGGLGVLGLSGMARDAASEATQRAVALAGGAPVGANAQLAPRSPATGDRERIMAVLAPFRAELDLPLEPALPAAGPTGEELLEAALQAGATVVTTFEDPTPVIGLARAAGAPLLAMVTTPEEALAAISAGANAVIAQGSESGGHRSTFVGAEIPTSLREVGTMALVPQVIAAVGPDVPVIASGGIMDGHGIAAALALGAAGVSLGTRFMAASESGIPDSYRRALAACPADGTVVTDAVTGRPCRMILNRIVSAIIEAHAGTLGWGAQAAQIADIRRAAAVQGRTDLMIMLGGQGAGLSGEPMPASAIMAQLVDELRLAHG